MTVIMSSNVYSTASCRIELINRTGDSWLFVLRFLAVNFPGIVFCASSSARKAFERGCFTLKVCNIFKA